MYLLAFILRIAKSEGLLIRFHFSQDPKSCCCGSCVDISEQGSGGNGSRGLYFKKKLFLRISRRGVPFGCKITISEGGWLDLQHPVTAVAGESRREACDHPRDSCHFTHPTWDL